MYSDGFHKAQLYRQRSSADSIHVIPAHVIPAQEVYSWLKADSHKQFALIDVREPGEYNNAHIPGAALIPRRDIEYRIADAVPHKGTHVVLCDDDMFRAVLASITLSELGYRRVSVLQGGINHWVTEDLPTEWGVNVPSKDFGERVEVEHAVPEIDAVELHRRIERGDELVILDTRTPEEYARLCIPGGRSVPGAELALRITDIVKPMSADATVIINCAGRTRSIIGTRVLQRMGLTNVVGLKNGTAGWRLAGFELEAGADRLVLPQPSPESVASAEAYADRISAEDGVQYLHIPQLKEMMQLRDTQPVYLVDVRTQEEYEDGHIPGFQWFPGGQAVQRSDDLAVVKNCPIVFCCDGRARAAITASWYRQMGHPQVYAVHGGTAQWHRLGNALQTGHPQALPLGIDAARSKVRMLSPQQVRTAAESATLIFVDTSQDFASAHIPGSHWIPRGWLESQISDAAPDKSAPVIVTCSDGGRSTFAGAALVDDGYTDVAVLAGGIAAWQKADLPIEHGLTGVMSTPSDVVPAGTERSYADMMNYLRWEIALGDKYQP